MIVPSVGQQRVNVFVEVVGSEVEVSLMKLPALSALPSP